MLIAAAALVYVYFGVSADTEGTNTALTFASVIATALYAGILFWDHWTDAPQLEIQTKEINISKRNDFCKIAIPVLNSGRRDAIDWRGRIQIFNQECGDKVYDSEINGSSSSNNKKIVPDGTAFFERSSPSFKGAFVTEIVVSTHKSEDVKIIEIDNTSEDIPYKHGIRKTCSFGLKKCFIGYYRNNWDIDSLKEGLGEFEDLSAIKQVVKMLGQTGDENAVKPLVDCLEDEDICEDAARTLGDLQNERAVEPLLKCLRKYNFTGQLGQIFEKTDGRNCVEDLIRILKEGDRSGDYVRRIGVVLGMIGKNTDEETVEKIQEAVIKLLEEVKEDIRKLGISNQLSDLIKNICNVLGDIGFTEEALNAVEKIDDNIIGNKKELVGKIERRIQKRKGVE